MPWGVVAGAALTAGAGAAEGHAQRGAARSARNQDRWISDAGQDLVRRAQSIADRSYTPYQGDRIAGLAPGERTAIGMANDAVTFNRGQGYLDKAGASIDGVTDWGTETMERYMNPYIGGVVDNTLRKENEAYQTRLANLRGGAAARGAFGGDRATLLEAQETGRHLDTVGDLTSQGYSDAYRNALNAWQADNNTKLAVSDAYRAVGGDVTRMNSQQITDLLRTGGTDRLLRQMDLDVDYGNFIEQRDWDVNNLEPLIRAVSAGKGGGAGTAIPANNTASALLGAGATIAGYFGQRDRGSTGTGAVTGYTAPETIGTPNAGNLNVTRPVIDFGD